MANICSYSKLLVCAWDIGKAIGFERLMRYFAIHKIVSVAFWKEFLWLCLHKYYDMYLITKESIYMCIYYLVLYLIQALLSLGKTTLRVCGKKRWDVTRIEMLKTTYANQFIYLLYLFLNADIFCITRISKNITAWPDMHLGMLHRLL